MARIRLSKHIKDLTELWISWVDSDIIARDESLSIDKRFDAVMKCEKMIEKRRRIVNQINKDCDVK